METLVLFNLSQSLLGAMFFVRYHNKTGKDSCWALEAFLMSETQHQTWLNGVENSCHMLTILGILIIELFDTHEKKIKTKLLFRFSYFYLV